MTGKICKYKNGAKSAYTFVFDDGCYKESTLEVYEIFKSIYEKTGIKFKATSAQTVNFLHEGLIQMWQMLFDEGYFDLASHSITHCITYNAKTPIENLEFDAKETKARLEAIYKNQKSLTHATPGGGSDEVGCSILKKYYIANRNGRDCINIPGQIDWYDVGTFTAMLKRTSEEYIQNIDRVIENEGWSVQINHWITKKEEDVFHSQSYKTFVDQCNYLMEKAVKNEVWVTGFSDAALYLQEAECSVLEISESVEGVSIFIKCPLDSEIYSYPLSAEIDSAAPLYKENGEVLLPENGKIIFDAPPNTPLLFLREKKK